jgi:hypothetical protein
LANRPPKLLAMGLHLYYSEICNLVKRVEIMAKKRGIIYIDGFNLYHGLKRKGWIKYLWLDLEKFSQTILPPDHELELVRYFTSRVKAFDDDPAKPIRQGIYLDAVDRLKPKVLTEYGTYQAFQSHCRHCDGDICCAHCGKPHVKPNEKKTDVNIATFMLIDAFENRCDTQILVSGDGDYGKLLSEIRRVFPEKELIVAFPPRRKNNQLEGKTTCTSSFVIRQRSFSDSQFDENITFISEEGIHVTLTRPPTWS